MGIMEFSDQEINIIFNGPPGPMPIRFIEIEDADGNSINVGEWARREDDYWSLRIPHPSVKITKLEAEIERLEKHIQKLENAGRV